MNDFVADDAVRVRQLTRLVEVSVILNSTLELEPLLRYIMDAAAEITNAGSASILLIDPNTKELHFMAFDTAEGSDNVQSELMRIPVPLQGSIAGSVVLENQSIVIDDVASDPRHYRKADDTSGFQTNSLLGVPMAIKDRVVGVLEAVNKKGDSWTEDDQLFLEILASQAAVALENANLVKQLKDAYDELSQFSKMKDDFIAIASHELRTPLSIVLGYASFLKDEAQGNIGEHAERVLTSALRMRQLIEDMTNLRYLKIGDGELDIAPIPVENIMKLALNDVESTAQANGMELEYSLPSVEMTVTVDSTKTVMALTNILNNAIKFSAQGKRINFTYEERPDEVWLIVQDEGAGFPPDDAERIFEEFYQVEHHMTRKHNGMGLGLAIARAVILANNGRIWARSDGQDTGATFFISLPLN